MLIRAWRRDELRIVGNGTVPRETLQTADQMRISDLVLRQSKLKNSMCYVFMLWPSGSWLAPNSFRITLTVSHNGLCQHKESIRRGEEDKFRDRDCLLVVDRIKNSTKL